MVICRISLTASELLHSQRMYEMQIAIIVFEHFFVGQTFFSELSLDFW